jgi:hypothetical protein
MPEFLKEGLQEAVGHHPQHGRNRKLTRHDISFRQNKVKTSMSIIPYFTIAKSTKAQTTMTFPRTTTCMVAKLGGTQKMKIVNAARTIFPRVVSARRRLGNHRENRSGASRIRMMRPM